MNDKRSLWDEFDCVAVYILGTPRCRMPPSPPPLLLQLLLLLLAQHLRQWIIERAPCSVYVQTEHLPCRLTPDSLHVCSISYLHFVSTPQHRSVLSKQGYCISTQRRTYDVEITSANCESNNNNNNNNNNNKQRWRWRWWWWWKISSHVVRYAEACDRFARSDISSERVTDGLCRDQRKHVGQWRNMNDFVAECLIYNYCFHKNCRSTLTRARF